MKRFTLIMSLFCLSFFALAQDATEASPNGAEITFVDETVDYGEVEYGSDGKRQFTFTNTGNEPLIITSCKGSCGCTVPKCPTEPILPGETANIDVKYDTKRPGPFTKTITIRSNAGSSSKIVKIKGTVKPKPQEVTTPVKESSPVFIDQKKGQ